MRYPHRIKIYKKRWHLVVTFVVIVLPFFFIAAFSRITGVEATSIFADLGRSAFRMAIAYAITVVLALFLSIVFGQGKIGNFFLPVFDVLQNFPSFALLPLFTLWFGPGNFSVIVFLVITIIWPILFSILSSIHMVRKDLEEAAYIFGARGWKKIWAFTIPNVFPGLMTGSLVGLGDGWEAVVGAEIIGLTPGIGKFLGDASAAENIRVLAFGIIALLLFIFTLNKLIFLPLLKRSQDYSHE